MSKLKFSLCSVFILSLFMGLAVAQEAEILFWTSSGSTAVLRQGDLEGNDKTDFFAGNLTDPEGIIVDSNRSVVYWVDENESLIRGADLNGALLYSLTEVGDLFGLAIDPINEHLYWSNATQGVVVRANLDLSSRTEIITGLPLNAPQGLAHDVEENRMYWVDFSGGKIMYADLSSPSIHMALHSNLNSPVDVALDKSSQHVYWSERGPGAIRRSSLIPNSAITNIVTGIEPSGIALDIESEKLFWTDSNADMVSRIDFDGTNLTLIESIVDPFGVAVFRPPTVQNNPPTAQAGIDQSIREGDTVSLDGSASFDDNTASAALDYAWNFSSLPAGSTATVSGANTATPSFAADVAGSYSVELVVTDESGLTSDPDEVEISSDNLAPTAAAGDDVLVIIGSNVVLDGAGSNDPDMDSLTFAWTIASAPGNSSAPIGDANMEMASLIPDVEGVFDVTLTVSDFIGPGIPDTVLITATTAEGYAETQIVSADNIVAALTPGQVTTGGNQNAFQNFLRQAIIALQSDDIAKAIDKLEKAIVRTDGYVLRGAPDGNGLGRDWITDYTAQTQVYNLLNNALNVLLAL